MERNRPLSFVSLVLIFGATSLGASAPPPDTGATGAWQRILKLTTIASAMHTTAHPDDEHGGLLALLSRRDGVLVSLILPAVLEVGLGQTLLFDGAQQIVEGVGEGVLVADDVAGRPPGGHVRMAGVGDVDGAKAEMPAQAYDHPPEGAAGCA